MGDEQIVTHLVPKDRISEFAAERRAAGVAVDVRVLMLLAPSLL